MVSRCYLGFILASMFIVFSKSTSSDDLTKQVPVGHLKPLGSHRPPETNLVDDLEEMPSPQEFWTKYVLPSKAVVLRGAAKHGKAFTLWTDEYVKEKFADLEVRLEGKKEKSSKVPIGAKGVGRDTIGNFISNYHKEDNNLYIVSELPIPMWSDVTVIPPLTCGLLKDRLVEVDLWLSGGGTKSILHKDAYNAVNCLYNGTKEWKMIEYKYEDKIYKAWEPPQMVGGFSRINVRSVDLLKYPKVAEVPWSFVTVHAGDCLFLPKSYYHQVTSYGSQNTAVALLFSRLDGVSDIDFTDCDQPLSFKPLSEMDVDWKYTGHGNLSMGNTDLESVREGMLEFFGSDEQLDKDGILRRSENAPQGKTLYSYVAGVRQHALSMFNWLGGDKKGFVSKDDVRRLSRDEMRAFVLVFEGTDVSNTEEAEHGVIDPGYIREIIKNLLVRDGYISKDNWIQAYMEETGGTKHYAEMNVAKLQSEHAHWLIDEVTVGNKSLNLEGSDINETIEKVNKAEEGERTRRMSIPFSCDVEETDLDISLTSGQLSNVHQELLHLFAIHDAKYQMECERERRTVENTKYQMHEELLSNMARRKAREIFEMERRRRIEEMTRLTDTVSEEGIAMAETNERLSQVHEDLKNAFKRMRDAKATKEAQEREKTEDLKEMMLQEIRRRPTGSEADIIEKERKRREELYQLQLNERRKSHESLLQVQEQLLKIFGKLKREKKVKKIETQQNQEANKERMQEELIRKSFQKEVSRQEAQEKARRIKESKSQIGDGDDAKTKAIDMLVDVQKQLLDAFAISKVQDVKQRMDHLKVMNCRQNMLQEIRSRRVDRENSSGMTRKSNVVVAKSGRRLSLIGERFQHEVTHTPSSLETLNE